MNKIILTILTFGLSRLNWGTMLVTFFSHPIVRVKQFLTIVGFGTCVYWGTQINDKYHFISLSQIEKIHQTEHGPTITVYPWNYRWWSGK